MGGGIETAVAKLRRRYPYDHNHDATSVAAILTELASADSVRDHLAAPGPVALQAEGQPHQANAATAATTASHVRRLVYGSSSDKDNGTAASATGSSSDSTAYGRSSRTRPPSRRHGERTSERGSSRHRSHSRSAEHTADNNPCKHCKKHGRRNRHPGVAEERCFWNKKWKGFRPRYCCTAMDVKFKSRARFSAKLGGYDDNTTSGEESE